MVIILAGAPGAGKGTQADLLVQELGFAKLSTGDALRRQIRIGSEIGQQAEQIMAAGKLVSDSVLLNILQAELANLSGKTIILDGYPRNLDQAITLAGLVDDYPIKGVIHIDVSHDILMRRLVGRRVCESCGASYHLDYDPPQGDLCRRCGGVVSHRPDDREDKVEVRLKVYCESTRPILDYYESVGLYNRVDGVGSSEEVHRRIVGVLDSLQ